MTTPAFLRRLCLSSLILAGLALPAILPPLRAAGASPTIAKPAVNAPVTVNDEDTMFILDNGIVTARINKRNGDIEALLFKGIDTMGHDQGRAGYWEQDPAAAEKVGGLSQSITIDALSFLPPRAAEPVATANGPARPWLILNVRRRKMNRLTLVPSVALIGMVAILFVGEKLGMMENFALLGVLLLVSLPVAAVGEVAALAYDIAKRKEHISSGWFSVRMALHSVEAIILIWTCLLIAHFPNFHQ